MALNNKFNAKNGISVGIPSVSVIDNVGNAIFPTVSARQYLGLQPSLSGLAALVDGNSLGSALTIGTNDNFNLNLETAGTTKVTVTSAGSVGIGTTVPASPLHLISGINSNIYLGTSATNDGIHEIRFGFIPAPTNSYAASIVGIRTGGNGRGSLEFRVAGGGDSTNAIQSDTGIRITSADIQILKSLVYAQDVLAIGDNYNSGVKAFKFTRSENKAAIWSVPVGGYGNGDIRFTTGNEASAVPKTESDATFIISRSGGVVVGNSYIAQYPTNGNLLVQNSIGIGTTSPVAKLDIADTALAGSTGLSGSILNLTQTWATSGAPTAIKLNVTNTASGAASNLLDLQVDTVSKFKVDKSGIVYCAAGAGFYAIGGGNVYIAGPEGALIGYNLYHPAGNYNGVSLINTARISWNNTNNNYNGGNDLFILRDTVGTLAQRNGVNPQELRVYRTYTDASNYERFFIRTNTGTTSATQIGLSAVGTGQNRDLEFATAGTTRMTVTSAGFVGIGTTTPSTILDISDSTGSQKNVTLTLRNGNFGWWNITSSNSNTSGFLRFASQNSGQTPLTLDGATGNVGIGTTTPSTKLEIVTTGSVDGLKLKRADDDRTAWLVDEGTGSGALYLFNGSNSNTVFITGNGNSFISSGNLGLGTSSSTAKLDILDTTLAVSGALSGSALNIAQTWNTTGAPNAIKLNVTNTASGAASNLLDLQVDTVSKFKVNKLGDLTLAGSTGVTLIGGGGFRATSYIDVNIIGLITSSSGGIGFSSGGTGATYDTALFRDAAGTLAQRNGVNPQAFRLYNTYTDATTFERLNIKWDSNILRFQTEKGSVGGTTRSIQFFMDGSTRMAISPTSLVTIADETGTQQRVLNNYACLNNSYSASTSYASTPWLLDAATNDILHGYNTRLTVTNTGTAAASGVFTQTIEWPSSELTDVNGMVYAEGTAILRCYYLQNAQSVRFRLWNNSAGAWGSWYTATNITGDSQWGVWRASLGGNYLTKLELETTSPPGNSTNVMSVEYYPTRSNSGIRFPHKFAAQGASRLLIGGGTSGYCSIVGSGTTLKVRNGNDSADGSITAAAGTFSTTLSVAGTSSLADVNIGSTKLIRIGGTTNTFTAVRNSSFGTGRLAVRLADDSAYGMLGASGFEVFNGNNRAVQFSLNMGGGIGGVGFDSQMRLVWASTNSASADTNIGASADTGITRISAGLIGIGTSGAGSFAGSIKATNAEFVGSTTVAGVISSSNVIYASGGNSNLWNSTYTTVNTNSANWTSNYTTTNANSANWSSVYTTTNANSANWSSVYTTTNANSANWSSSYTAVSPNSANWNSNYTTTGANSANWSNVYSSYNAASANFVSSNSSPSFNNLTVTGNLSVQGDFTYLNTSVSVTSALSVVNTGTGPALYVRQTGTQPIAHFIDAEGTGDIIFANNGFVGLGIASPSERLTVSGSISSNSIIYAAGGNSGSWNSNYTTTNGNSANWNSTYTTVNANSANYILAGGNSKGTNLLIGTNDSFDLNLETGGTTKMTVTNAGTVGIGTTSPTNLLHIYSEATSGAAQLVVQNDTDTTVPIAQFIRRRASGAAVLSNDSLGRITASGAKSSSVNLGAGYIEFQANGSPAAYSNILPSKINFVTFVNDAYSTYVNSIVTGAFVAGGTTGQFIFNKNDNIGGDYGPDTGISRLSAGIIGIGNATAGSSGGTLIAGKVGIGTTAPGYLLDLNGNGRVTNSLFFGTSSLASMGMVGSNLTINSYAGNPVKIDVLQVTSFQFGVTFQYGDLTLNKSAGTDTYIRSTNQDLRLQSGSTYNLLLNPTSGNVGIGTITPTEKLTVVGNISATNVVYASGGNSNIWNSTYATVTAVSANGASTSTTVNANSANWSSAYTAVAPNSANWNSNYTTTGTNSANWSSVYTTTRTNSANWNNVYTTTGTNSANWSSAYTSVAPNSANWNSTYTNVNTNSPSWNSVYSTTNANSANWSSSYLAVTAVSANTASIYTTVNANSANWSSVYTTTGANSANWNSVYSTTGANSANWNSNYTTTNANSANWSSVYSTVASNSANYILDGGNTKGANITIGTNDNFNLNLETAGSSRMTVTSGGNVGIGTTTPTSKLEIVDTTSAINLSGAALNISHTWNAAGVDVTAIKLNVNSSASGTNSKLLDLQIGGTSYFKVDKTGATTMASAVFVNGGNSNLWNSAYTTTNTNSASYIVNGGNTLGGTVTIGTNDANNFNLETSGTARVSISSTGQVGIGTTTPDADLVVYKNVVGAPTTLKIRTATGTGSRLDFYRTDAYVATRFDVLSTNEFQFYNNNDVTTPKYIVNGTNGNFGIGTTNTVHKVTVGGSLSASGTLYGERAILGDAAASVYLERDAANILGLRNGIAAQTFNIYGTSSSNNTVFERLTLSASSIGGVIGHAVAGGGVARGLLFQTNNATRMTIAADGSVNVAGHFSAATKSFLIDHPTREGKKLQYGVVESNQHSVLVRGKTSENIIELPEEWSGLVHEDNVTVQLTPIGSYQQLYVVSQDNLRVVVGGSTGIYNYTIFGERKDVNKLQTEI